MRIHPRAGSGPGGRVHYWPALIDMLASFLALLMLMYFVENHFNEQAEELARAQRKRVAFVRLFEAEFRREIDAGAVVHEHDLNLLQIRFGDGVLFERGRYDLAPAGAALLGRLGAVFREADRDGGARLYEQIQIEGHTDDSRMDHERYPRDNWELSTARATAVLRHLTRRVQPRLDERRMSVNGYAEHRPLAGGDRQRNRRIELRIYFSGKRNTAAEEGR